MDLLLLIITAVSVLAAIALGVVVWRLSHAERARSAARIAALAAAAADRDTVSPAPRAMASPARAMGVSDESASAAINESRAPWTPARVTAFHGQPAAERRRAASPGLDAYDREHADQRHAVADLPPAPAREAFLGSAVGRSASGNGQRGLAIAAVVLFAAVLTGGYWTIYGDASEAGAVAAERAAAPLELISLSHERRGAQLSVSGQIRNPLGGAPADRVAAVVLLFDQQGALVTSTRADVDFTTLGPGDESPFVVTATAPDTVTRYRVSFRNDAGVVPHVDRRGQQPIAEELP